MSIYCLNCGQQQGGGASCCATDGEPSMNGYQLVMRLKNTEKRLKEAREAITGIYEQHSKNNGVFCQCKICLWLMKEGVQKLLEDDK